MAGRLDDPPITFGIAGNIDKLRKYLLQLSEAFDEETGHDHSGAPGEGRQIAVDQLLLGRRWDNASRPTGLAQDTIGYNTEESRLELYRAEEDRWYYLWQGPVGVTPVDSPALFSDNFEQGWFTDTDFSQLAVESFETGWPESTSEGWALLFAEGFGESWFVSRELAQLMVDSFELGWHVDCSFSSLFIENFEGAWE